jgi:hypothetical protein
VKFCTYTLIDNWPDPISGVQLTPYERFQHVVRQAQWAEELGFDGYGVGERHAQRFISSSPPVVLSYIAAVWAAGHHHREGERPGPERAVRVLA